MSEFHVRCFKRERDRSDEDRCGIWIMTGEHRGAFFHGDREEIQPPRWSVEHLAENFCEITATEALEALATWPQGAEQARKILKRHGVLVKEPKC